MTQIGDNVIERLETGVPNLDAILHGGIPKNSMMVLAGPPGSGKTILAQQICFHHAAQGGRVLYFNTLSISAAKSLLYLRPFDFFDQSLMEERVRFVDLGMMLRTKGLDLSCNLLMDQIKQFKPSIIVIDSFKVFDDLARSNEELRKFAYELTVRLMAWECTAFLLGEYDPADFQHPTFSAIDGIITLKQSQLSGEQQRMVQVIKLRGTSHSRDEHSFLISRKGVEIFAPSVTLGRPGGREAEHAALERLRTGVSRLDELLGPGIPWGSSLIVSGPAGSGKTVLGLEFLYRGARDFNQKGLFFSFEETEERIRAIARGLGWDLEREIERGMIEILFIPQPDILVDAHLLMMNDRLEAFGAARVVIDSMSVFLHKIKDTKIVREKVFQLASMIQLHNAVGFFNNDIAYGSHQISRFGVEETVVDGVILLRAEEEGMDRLRYLEVYKLRNTPHAQGRHAMKISEGGIQVFPRVERDQDEAPQEVPSAMGSKRLPSGMDGLDDLMGGGLLEASVTLLSGSPGTGKSTLAMQFVLAAAERREKALFITLEEGPEQVVKNAESLKLPLRQAVEDGWVEVMYLNREHLHVSRFLPTLLDKVIEGKVSRLVLDSASDAELLPIESQDLRRLLDTLVIRLRSLRVTTLLTLESRSLYLTETLSEQRLSAVADNIVVLRFLKGEDRLVPVLTVVKARGSRIDRGTYRFEIGPGGVLLGRPPAKRGLLSKVKAGGRVKPGKKKKT